MRAELAGLRHAAGEAETGSDQRVPAVLVPRCELLDLVRSIPHHFGCINLNVGPGCLANVTGRLSAAGKPVSVPVARTIAGMQDPSIKHPAFVEICISQN